MSIVEIDRRVPRFRIGPRSAGALMTPEEFDATPEWAWDQSYRYELIHGVLVVVPPPGNGEVDPNQYLGYLLLGYQENHPSGHRIDLTLPEQTLVVGKERRRCDRAIWTGLGRLPDPSIDVPTIVIEFVSQSRRDRVRDYQEKLSEYQGIGVSEYWIIDRFDRSMTVHRKDTKGRTSQTLSEDLRYETDVLPGFVLPLGRLLGRADLWETASSTRKSKPDTPEV